jgi:hypothetical protein
MCIYIYSDFLAQGGRMTDERICKEVVVDKSR